MEGKVMLNNYFIHVQIAGFTYYDGVDVFSELNIGTLLDLIPEPDNKFDPCAVSIYFKKHKLGYIPRDKNREIFLLLSHGYNEIFIAKINKIKSDTNPENQIGVVVKIKGNN